MLNIKQMFGRSRERREDSGHSRQRIRLDSTQYAVMYFLGDIHGCIRELIEAEKRIAEDALTIPGRKLQVFVGDYVDRGPHSRSVLEHLCRPPMGEFDRVTLCGNHDDEFLRFLHNAKANMSWLEHGGAATLRSYGIDADYILKNGGGFDALVRAVHEAVPTAHIEFLESLPILLDLGDFVAVHAGVKPGVPLAFQKDIELMWIREPFLSEGPGMPFTVIHGHTAAIEPEFGINRIGIDTGLFATGRLTVLKIADGKTVII